jgi:serine/threonine protein kinase
MESPKNYYIIEELCDRDLSQDMRAGVEMAEAHCIDILTQLCTGFLALVREGIIHRDLKPANVMARGKTYKLGDFGFSKQCS